MLHCGMEISASHFGVRRSQWNNMLETSDGFLEDVSLASRIPEDRFYRPWPCPRATSSWHCAHWSTKLSHSVVVLTDASTKNVLMDHVSSEHRIKPTWKYLYLLPVFHVGSFGLTFVWFLSLHNICTDFRVYAGYPWPWSWWASPWPWPCHLCPWLHHCWKWDFASGGLQYSTLSHQVKSF